MKPHVCFVVGRYYPNSTAPGECAAKLIDFIKADCRLSVIAIHTHGHGVSCVHNDRESIYFATNWRNRLRVLITDLKPTGHPLLIRMGEMLIKAITGLSCILSFSRRDAWYGNKAYRALCRLHRETPIDTVVSVSFPFFAHLAAQKFKHKHPMVRWITYSVDTFFNNPSTYEIPWIRVIQRRIEARRERRVMGDATHNFVSEEIFASCPPLIDPFRSKTSPLPYVISKLPQPTDVPVFFETGKIHLLYAGSLYLNLRTPEYLLDVFSKTRDERLVLHIFARPGDCMSMLSRYKERIGARLRLHAPVSVTEIRKLMQQCDVLVNLSNNCAHFFPSKAFDYIATGRPLINFVYRGAAPSGVFARYPMILEIENFGNPESDSRGFAKFCETHAGRRLDADVIAGCYPEHMPQKALARFKEEVFRPPHYATNAKY